MSPSGLPHERLGNADPSITVGELAEALKGRSPDWVVEIYVVGNKVVELGLELEDIHFEYGKMILTTGSQSIIYIEPLEFDELDGDDG